ncbi:hypothetical protein [Collimonas fungivorans]|uniref:Phage-related protein n=1 Tax=Collimonas fungivorans (strain Ter331) TaxID=1005048 RepID=G0AHA0_COLFT|nr:hypothetical protein [Collimonas fungivorans]AEK62506.1 Phage-related protein [Collimonas fungivorans Ter331]
MIDPDIPVERLWVRETWGMGSRPDPWGGYDGIEYRADEAWLSDDDDLYCHKVKTPEDICLSDYRSGWHPSIHMPRWANRILLEITAVRVERLQDISAEDAYAEGAAVWAAENAERLLREGNKYRNIIQSFAALWDSTGGSWAANPWVWVVEFKRIDEVK